MTDPIDTEAPDEVARLRATVARMEQADALLRAAHMQTVRERDQLAVRAGRYDRICRLLRRDPATDRAVDDINAVRAFLGLEYQTIDEGIAELRAELDATLRDVVSQRDRADKAEGEFARLTKERDGAKLALFLLDEQCQREHDPIYKIVLPKDGATTMAEAVRAEVARLREGVRVLREALDLSTSLLERELMCLDKDEVHGRVSLPRQIGRNQHTLAATADLLPSSSAAGPSAPSVAHTPADSSTNASPSEAAASSSAPSTTDEVPRV